jgi:hypothetical protein
MEIEPLCIEVHADERRSREHVEPTFPGIVMYELARESHPCDIDPALGYGSPPGRHEKWCADRRQSCGLEAIA